MYEHKYQQYGCGLFLWTEGWGGGIVQGKMLGCFSTPSPGAEGSENSVLQHWAFSGWPPWPLVVKQHQISYSYIFPPEFIDYLNLLDLKLLKTSDLFMLLFQSVVMSSVIFICFVFRKKRGVEIQIRINEHLRSPDFPLFKKYIGKKQLPDLILASSESLPWLIWIDFSLSLQRGEPLCKRVNESIKLMARISGAVLVLFLLI